MSQTDRFYIRNALDVCKQIQYVSESHIFYHKASPI